MPRSSLTMVEKILALAGYVPFLGNRDSRADIVLPCGSSHDRSNDENFVPSGSRRIDTLCLQHWRRGGQRRCIDPDMRQPTHDNAGRLSTTLWPAIFGTTYRGGPDYTGTHRTLGPVARSGTASIKTMLGAMAFAALMPAVAVADTQAIAPGGQITATQVGHIFDAVCFADTPIGMDKRVTLAESAFFFAPTDLDTDFGYLSADEAISVTLDGDALEKTCQVAVSTDIAGDGADLYDSVAAHLADHLDGTLPAADYTDSGVVWQWDQTDASFTLEYTENGDLFLLKLTGES